MKKQEFLATIEHMKQSSVSRRLVFLWRGNSGELENVLKGLEIHKYDIASVFDDSCIDFNSIQKNINNWLKETCRNYDDNRNEPSALILMNSILLARYNCDLTPILRFGISPRSSVILVFPKDTQRKIPIRAEKWIKKDTKSIVIQTAKQLGEPKSIIED